MMKIFNLQIFLAMLVLIGPCVASSDTDWWSMSDREQIAAQNRTGDMMDNVTIDELNINNLTLLEGVEVLNKKLASMDVDVSVVVDVDFVTQYPREDDAIPYYDAKVSVHVVDEPLDEVIHKILVQTPGVVYGMRSKEIVINLSTYFPLQDALYSEIRVLSDMDITGVEYMNLGLLNNLMNATMHQRGRRTVSFSPFFSEDTDLTKVNLPASKIKGMRIIDFCNAISEHFDAQWIYRDDGLVLIKNER